MHGYVRRPHRLLPLVAALALLALAGPAFAAPAGTTVLVSRPDGTGLYTPPLDGPANPSAPLAVSDDGRYVAFVSISPGLDPAAVPFVQNVYLRDTVANTTTLVSRSDGFAGAGVNISAGADVRPDPNHVLSADTLSIALQPVGGDGDAPHNQTHVLVAFTTAATNLVDHTDRSLEATNGHPEVWMRDVTAGTTYLVSRVNGRTGAPANGTSFQPSMAASPSGPLVAYTSTSTNLYPPQPTGNERAVYLREVGTGVDHRVDNLVFCVIDACPGAPPSGTSEQPSLRYVTSTDTFNPMCPMGSSCAIVAFLAEDPAIFHTFPSDPGQLQAVGARAIEQPDGTLGDFGNFRVASVSRLDSTLAPTGAQEPKLTRDGEGVGFLSDSPLVQNFLPGKLGVEAYYAFTGGTAFANLSYGMDGGSGGLVLADRDITHLSVGGIGTRPRIGTGTAASNWAAGARGFGRAYAEGSTGAQALLDTSTDGTPGNGPSDGTEISADGTTAVFSSSSTNLGAGGGVFTRIYKRVLDPGSPDFGKLQLVSRPSGSGPFPQGGTDSRIGSRVTSADGRFVAFQSQDVDLVAGNVSATPSVTHVFVRDTVNGTTTLVDRANGANGAPAEVGANLVGISDDGHRVMFTSGAVSLLCAGCDRNLYAYVRDIPTNTTILVSAQNGADGLPAGVEPDRESLSGDGNRAAFGTSLPLDQAANNGHDHLYVRDIAKSTTTFVDREDGPKGLAANRGPFESSLNRDGTKVAWETDALLGDVPYTPESHDHVYVRDLTAGTTVVASRADGAAGAVADNDSDHPVIDGAGDAVAFESDATNLGPVTHRAIWLRRLNTNQTLLVSRSGGADGAPADVDAWTPSIDAAGDKVAFRSSADNLGAAGGAGPAVGALGLEAFVRNLTTNTTDLVSRVTGVNGAPADPGGVGAVSISANGACVAFSGQGVNFSDPLARELGLAVRERATTSACALGTGGGVSAPTVDGEPPAAGLVAPPKAVAAALSRLLASPARFFVGAHGGTKLSFALSRPATVTLAFDRLLAGHTHGTHCVAGAAHGGRRCTLVRRAGRLVVHAHAGVNRIRFSGRIGRRALALGRYRWMATPLHGRGRAGRFTVAAPPRAGSAKHGP